MRNLSWQGSAVTVFVHMEGLGGEWHHYGLDDTVLTTEGPEPLPQPTLAVADRSASTLRITFNAAMNAADAANTANYSVTDPSSGQALAVLSVQVVDAFTVILTTVPQTQYVDYSVQVQNISGPTTPVPPPVANGTLPVRTPHTLVALDAATVWKYDQSGANHGTAWRDPAFNDGAWPSGPALLAFETSALPPYDLPATALLATGNLLAAEVHQANGTSGDIVFGTVLEALVLPSQLSPDVPMVLNISRQGDAAELLWTPPSATLQQAADLSGPWTNVTGATSPWPVPLDQTKWFFRLHE